MILYKPIINCILNEILTQIIIAGLLRLMLKCGYDRILKASLMRLFFKFTISLLIFLTTLEALSWLALNMGIKPPWQRSENLIISFSEVEEASRKSDRLGEVSKVFLAWKNKHPEINNPPYIDVALRSETARYVYTGFHTKRNFFEKLDEPVPNSDDEYALYGQQSGKLKYKIRYKTDEFGRRITGYEHTKNARLNIIFVGCSFTFGEGVTPEETIPTITGKLLGSVRTYNLGVPGSSLAGRLSVIMKNPQLLKGIDPKIPTVIVYIFLDDHLRRMVGTSELLQRGEHNYRHIPAFSLKNGELILQEGFDEDFWNFHWLIYAYSKTNFSRLSRLELPHISTPHFILQKKVLERLKNEVKKVLPLTDKVYFATFPGDNFYASKISPHLGNATFLDYSGINFQKILGHDIFYLPQDYHPHGRMYDLFSMLLVNDLKKHHPEL